MQAEYLPGPSELQFLWSEMLGKPTVVQAGVLPELQSAYRAGVSPQLGYDWQVGYRPIASSNACRPDPSRTSSTVALYRLPWILPAPSLFAEICYTAELHYRNGARTLKHWRHRLHDFIRADSVQLRGHNYKLYKNRSLKRCRTCFFSQRVVNCWNLLPQEVVEAPSLEIFKNRLDNGQQRVGQ